MPRDLDGLADIVVLTVKNAMAPALERIALLEKDNADLRAQLTVVGDLRDRVVTVETKAAIPSPLAADPPPPVDLTPMLERLAAAEARMNVIGDLRDRVVVMETKAAQPCPQGPIGPPGERGADGRDGAPGVPGVIPDGLDQRLAAVEMKTMALAQAGHISPDEISASLSGLFRKELTDLDVVAPRSQKRIVRDDKGQIERVIEETV